jgi:hypothetical protein
MMKTRKIGIVLMLVIAVGLLIFAGCGNGVNKAKFSAAWNSLAILHASASVGVSYADFGPLLQSYVAQLSLIDQTKLSTQEKPVFQTLLDVGQIYNDSYLLWVQEVQSSAGGSLVEITKGGVDRFDGASALVSKYALETSSLSQGTTYTFVAFNDSLQKIWQSAGAKISALTPVLAP